MSKRKGMSAEEKRTRMLELFYEKKEFFQLKELEKLAPKEKGIVAQSVKEVLQSLVDDSIVDSEKIGTSIYYWAYPSKTKYERKRKLESLLTSSNECKLKIKIAQDNLVTYKDGRIDGPERARAMSDVVELRNVSIDLQRQLAACSFADPEALDNIATETEEMRVATDRWTENIFALRNWCKMKIQVEENTFNEQFGIPTDFDYVLRAV